MDGLKVLCFHGFGTSGEFMKWQLRTWLEKFPKTTFIFYDGYTSFSAEYTEDDYMIKFHKDKPVWDNFSHYSLENLWYKDAKYGVEIDFAKETQKISKLIEDNGGIDGIIAFSQGTLMTEFFISHMELGLLNGVLKSEHRPYFVVLLCPHSGFVNNRQFSIPVFMMFGNVDTITETCFMHLMRYQNTRYTYFEGGHRPPHLGTRLYSLLCLFVEEIEPHKQKYREKKFFLMSYDKL